MKKISLLAALTGAFAVTAHAQSSVTLYGLLDAGVSYSNNVNTGVGSGSGDARFASGLMSSDRWGIKGSEDLGGGLKAVFNLENGFNIGTGSMSQGGREFGRNAYVGLASDTAGTVTLGRQNEFMYDWLGHVSFENYNGDGGNAFTSVMSNNNFQGNFRVDNSVKYTSANYSGLTFGGLYGFSNQADGFANNRAYSFGANYNNGPLKASLAYTQFNNGGGVANAAGGAVDTSSTTDSPFSAQLMRSFGGGLTYAFGPANVGFVVTHTKLEDATGFAAENGAGPSGSTTVPGADVSFTNYEVYGHYNLTPAWTLGTAYTYTDGKYNSAAGAASPKWNQVSLLSSYALSKRTSVYGLATYEHLSGGFAPGTAGIPITFEDASSYSGGTSGSTNQVVIGAGLKTLF